MAAPDDAENNNINAIDMQQMKDIELNYKMTNIHPIFSSIDEMRKQIYFMMILLRKSWANSEYLTIGIGSLAVLLGAITFDGELQNGGDYLKVGIAPLGDGLSAISPASFFQLILSMICWIYFLYRLWTHYPLMRGQSVSLFIMWFSITIMALSLHQGAPLFPFEISSEGITTAIGGLLIATFFGFVFSKAVIETRDIHVEENYQNEDPRIMGESIYNHSLFGWVSILIIWSIVSLISSWAGAHYVSIRPHGIWFWQFIYILFGTFSIFGICILLWYPQSMLGSGEIVIKSKRAREVDDMQLGEIIPKDEQGKCPECNTPSSISRGKDGLPIIKCSKVYNKVKCEGEGKLNSECSKCKSKLPKRIKCFNCGVSTSVLEHLSDHEAW